jgi:hypothetical protein
MSQLMTLKPFVSTVVTESPWIVALYPQEKVFIFRDGEWENPDIQTYGADIGRLTNYLFETKHTIPIAVASAESVKALRDSQVARYGRSLVE